MIADPKFEENKDAHSPFTVSAYVDIYLMGNFNNPNPISPLSTDSISSAGLRPGNTSFRFQDRYSNQITLNLVEVTLKHETKETRVLIDFDFGTMADMNSFYSNYESGNNVVDEVSKHVGQALVSYYPSSVPELALEIGKMVTPVGIEALKPKDNWNYSISVLGNYGQPNWHMGIHVGYSIAQDRFKTNLYILQGWNTLYANNSMPVFAGQLVWTPSDKTTATYTYMGGPFQAGADYKWKLLHVANLIHNFSDEWAMGAEAMYGIENGVIYKAQPVSGVDSGVQILAKWQPTKKFYISPRIEIYRDNSGYKLGDLPETVSSLALTTSQRIGKHVETRFELRHDRSTSNSAFLTRDGTTGTQTTLLFAVMYTI